MRNLPAIFLSVVLACAAVAAPIISTGGRGDRLFDPSSVSPNNAPVWSIPSTRDIANGGSCSLDLSTVLTDADGDYINYAVSSGSLPTGCTLSNGVISGTTTDTGAHAFVLSASDGNSAELRGVSSTAATLTFASDSFSPARVNRFVVSFPVTPAATTNIDHVCGFGDVSATGYANLLAAVRLNTSGTFDARNNSAYAADATVSFTGGSTYTVVMDINVPAGTYDVTVNGTQIANDYVFRGAATPASMGYVTCADAKNRTVGTASGPILLVPPVYAAVTWTVAAGGDVTAPGAPDAPTVTGVSQTTVSMSLPTSAAGDHSFYRIYRSPSGCAAYALIQDNYFATTYTDTGLTAGTQYCYRLVDVDTSENASSGGTAVTPTTDSVDITALLSMANQSLTEGNSGSANMTFTLTASSSQAFNIVCSYATSDGTASAGSDYTSTSGTATITAGGTTTTINVPVLGDTSDESNETFTLTVSNCGSGATAVNPDTVTATGTITDDDDTIGTSVTYTRSGSTITFTFSCTGGCQIGTFADNWSQWVAPVTAGGSVTISSITPTETGSGTTLRNGAMADPVNMSTQGFYGTTGSYIGGYSAAATITYPYVVTPATLGRPSVIIKSVAGSDANCTSSTFRQCFTHFETLTIVADDPGDVFRPPYFGTNKFMIAATDFDDSFLPSLPSSAGISWDSALATVQSVNMLPMRSSWEGSQGMSASINNQTNRGYHGYVVQQQGAALLKLTQAATGSDVAKKRQLALYVAQRGIDLYGITTTPGISVSNCAPWLPNGGFHSGKLPPIVLAANFLQQPDWLTWLDDLFSTHDGRGCFAETGAIQRNPTNLGKGVPTFGWLDHALYNISNCNGNNQNCASQGGSNSGALAGYDGLADGDPLTVDYPPAYMDIQGGQMFSSAITMLFIPQVRTTFPANGDHWLDWVVRVKSAGDADGASAFRYYNNVTNTNTATMNFSYISSGATTMWATFKSCYADNSCTGM